MAKMVGRKTIRIPTAGAGEAAHSPERVSTTRGAMAFVAHFFTLPGNTAPVYLGWAGTSGIPGMENAIPVSASDVTTLENPVRDPEGNIVPFDLYDLFISGSVNGEGVSYFTW